MNEPVILTRKWLYVAAGIAGVLVAIVLGGLWFAVNSVFDERDRAIAHDRAQDIRRALDQRRLRQLVIELRSPSPARVARQLRKCRRLPRCRIAIRRVTSTPRSPRSHSAPGSRRHAGSPSRGSPPGSGGGGPPGNGGPAGGSPAGGGQPPINVKPPTSLPLPELPRVCTPVVGVNCP